MLFISLYPRVHVQPRLKWERAWPIPVDFSGITECALTSNSHFSSNLKRKIQCLAAASFLPQRLWPLGLCCPVTYLCRISVSEPLSMDWSEGSRGGAIQNSFPPPYNPKKPAVRTRLLGMLREAELLRGCGVSVGAQTRLPAVQSLWGGGKGQDSQ